MCEGKESESGCLSRLGQGRTGKDYEGTFSEVMVMVWVTRYMDL